MMWRAYREMGERSARDFGTQNEGIVTIVGLIMAVILLIIYAMFSELISTTIDIAKGNTTSVIAQMMLDLYPAMILFGILISYFIYASSGRE